jgi:hypothetical protein
VVCERTLAEHVFRIWRGEELPDLIVVPSECAAAKLAAAAGLQSELVQAPAEDPEEAGVFHSLLLESCSCGRGSSEALVALQQAAGLRQPPPPPEQQVYDGAAEAPPPPSASAGVLPLTPLQQALAALPAEGGGDGQGRGGAPGVVPGSGVASRESSLSSMGALAAAVAAGVPTATTLQPASTATPSDLSEAFRAVVGPGSHAGSDADGSHRGVEGAAAAQQAGGSDGAGRAGAPPSSVRDSSRRSVTSGASELWVDARSEASGADDSSGRSSLDDASSGVSSMAAVASRVWGAPGTGPAAVNGSAASGAGPAAAGSSAAMVGQWNSLASGGGGDGGGGGPWTSAAAGARSAPLLKKLSSNRFQGDPRLEALPEGEVASSPPIRGVSLFGGRRGAIWGGGGVQAACCCC